MWLFRLPTSPEPWATVKHIAPGWVFRLFVKFRMQTCIYQQPTYWTAGCEFQSESITGLSRYNYYPKVHAIYHKCPIAKPSMRWYTRRHFSMIIQLESFENTRSHVKNLISRESTVWVVTYFTTRINIWTNPINPSNSFAVEYIKFSCKKLIILVRFQIDW